MDQLTIKQESNHDHEEESNFKNISPIHEHDKESSIIRLQHSSIDQVDGSVTQSQPSASQHAVRLCSKVKKEEEGGEIKLEWDGDECDCEECRVEREIKIEFNQNNANIQQQVNSSGQSQANQSGTSCQHSVCKRVKKEEDSEWDGDCDCDDCRRNRQKAIQLKQTNRTEFSHSSTQLIANKSEQICGGKDCEDAVATNRDELEDEGKNDQEGSNGQIGDKSEDHETKIDDEEYEMDVDGEESSDEIETEVDEQSEREPDDQSPLINRPQKASRKHVCEQCGKIFARLSNLTAHFRTHTGERPFKCPWERCEKTFIRKNQLTRHYKSHTGEYTKMCEHCGKKFIELSTFTLHIRTHTNERPFECSWEGCTMKFTRNENKKRHYKTHTGERTYKCDFPNCGRDFITNQHLKTHGSTHSNERLFVCHYESCTKKYKHKTALFNHQKTKHNRT